MAGKEIIPFGVDLNKLPPREDSLSIVPIEDPLPLAVIPPNQIVIVPPRRSYEQAYYARVCQPMFPPPQDRLLLNNAPKGPKIIVPRDVQLLPPPQDFMICNKVPYLIINGDFIIMITCSLSLFWICICLHMLCRKFIQENKCGGDTS
jgi:hypothetical protein